MVFNLLKQKTGQIMPCKVLIKKERCMIDKEDGKYYLYCDICDRFEKFDEWQDAVDFKRDNYWSSRKVCGEWRDICPECQE